MKPEAGASVGGMALHSRLSSLSLTSLMGFRYEELDKFPQAAYGGAATGESNSSVLQREPI